MNDTGITFEEMQGLLEGVYEIYGKGRASDFSGECYWVNSESARLWHYVLGGFPYYMVKSAFADHIEKSASVPIPCDIYRACLKTSTLIEGQMKLREERQRKENG